MANGALSRRQMMEVAGAAALSASASHGATMPSPRSEAKDTPKICLDTGAGLPATPGFDEAAARRVKQLGVEYVLSGGPRIPWEEAPLKERMDKFKAAGLTLGNLMIAGFPNAIYGRPGRDEEIEKVIQSIRVAGKVGLPVVEYNWYAHRAMEGYYEENGRAGSGLTSFDYQHEVDSNGAKVKFKDLPALPNEGAHTLDEMWANITYFLKKVIPECEKAGVRMALHPNDPPAPISRGSQQIMGSVEGWKHYVSIVDSPSNGITFDSGVTREMGSDPV